MESIDALADVSDIDEASTKLKEFLDNNILQSSHVLHRIAPLNILQLPESEEPSIADLYDSILQEWIAPIPAEVSTRVRQAKERLARRVAAEVTLASLRLQHHRDVTLSQDEGNRVSLPNLPAKPFGVSSLDADMFPSSLPTPPPSSVPPSLQPPSSPSVPASSLSTLTIDPLSRLSKHLVVNNESLTPTVIPPSVKELLSHWQLGSDPHTYEWEATERALQPEAEDDVSQELREKERKRKERREKRQRREDELMRAKSHSHNQPTFPRSSPGPTFGGIGGSSQVPVPTSSQMPSQVQTQLHGFGGFGVFGGMPQSQVEPGRFGGRPDKKKKKGKSRVSGF
jgi:RNA polymerase I-specific transcription initiation factor RRN6